MKRALLFLFCALISTQMFSESSSPYGTATNFARTDVASTTFNSDIEDISSDLRKKYLVEKITWYDDETNHKEAYYEYDNNNRLERRIIHSTYFEQGRVKYDTIVDNYEYTGGNLTKISHKDVYISYTYDLEYDNVGRLITSKYGNNIMHFCYRGGKMDSIWFDNDPERYTILKYDEHGNIVKEIMRVPEMDDIWGETPTGDYVFIEYEYQYDDKIRPFFNIDNAFVYDPIFGQGTTTPNHIRMLSTNNLIKYSRSSWHYTYNEEGLPIELRTSFEGVTPANDPKYVFTYRKIKKTESLADLFPTLWGLQRTSCTKTIGEDEYGTVWGSRSYLMQETQTTTIDGKQYMVFGDDQYNRFALREENNKILVYSSILKKDLVLYDFTLEVGDSLPALYFEERAHDTMQPWLYIGDIVDYNKDDDGTILPAETFVVTDISTITLLDGKEYKKWTFDNGMEYIEGIGSFGTSYAWNDFYQLIANGPLYSDVHSQHLVCVSKNGQLLYKMDEEEMERLGAECLCDAENPKELFPTLWGLQRTSCDEWFDGCGENKSYLFAPKEVKEINGKLYLKCGGVFLREEDSKVLIYSFPYEKDFVLYDYTLEVGGTLQNLGIDIYSFPELEYAAVVDYIAYEDYDVETDEFIIKKEPLGSKRVTEVSTITLLDGKEYKRWLFGNDWENGNYYVEGIGNVGGSFGGDYINIANPYGIPTCYLGERLVCASRNGKILYQMDDAEMERLGAECLCDYDSGPRKDNAKDGQIGGRPTPTQWNQLEVVLRQMDNNHTILQAETFSYTLEDISQQVNNKTYFQLARQSTKDTATTKSVVGALHFGKDEDNRVYFLRDGVEYVLYDFTAEIGDTVEIFAGINNYPQETTYTHVVVDKDTTEDGACRMFLEVVFPDETNTTAENAEKVWLAGLGSVDGIVHNAAKRTSNAHAAPSRSASNETESSVMLCAWREDSCLYTTNHPDYDTFGCVYNQDPTSVEDISTSQSSYQKIIREGQFLILHNGKTYSVMGIEL